MSQHRPRPLTALSIALINVIAICSIKSFPLLAEFGSSVVFFLLFSAIFFFIPVSLVSAELASAWPDRGVYTWVSKAMGPRFGFLAVWLQWIENVIWYPTMLSFVAATLAYLLDPGLATHNLYIMSTGLLIFWAATIVNFWGMRVSSWVSSVSALFGTILPMVVIILLGVAWRWKGYSSHIALSWETFTPHFTSYKDFVLLSGVLLGLAGMEMSAVHARDVKHPTRDYPKGIFFSALLILLFSVFGALTVATVIPAAEIQLASGGLEAFKAFFLAFNIPWATHVMAVIMVLGTFGMMTAWIIGPSRGLHAIAIHGDLPPLFHRINRAGMPVPILVGQGIIVSILSLVFLLMPTVNSSYWIMVALASLLYLLMYLLMFFSVIILRYKHPEVERPFRIPGGTIGLWITALFGIFGSSFGFFMGFSPPTQFATGHPFVFEVILAGGVLIFTLLPFWIYASRKPSWKQMI